MDRAYNTLHEKMKSGLLHETDFYDSELLELNKILSINEIVSENEISPLPF